MRFFLGGSYCSLEKTYFSSFLCNTIFDVFYCSIGNKACLKCGTVFITTYTHTYTYTYTYTLSASILRRVLVCLMISFSTRLTAVVPQTHCELIYMTGTRQEDYFDWIISKGSTPFGSTVPTTVDIHNNDLSAQAPATFPLIQN